MKRKTAREKRKNVCFPITCGPPQREELLRKILGGGFLKFIKQNYTDFEEERLREKKGIQINIRSSSGPPQREENFFSREIKN